MQYVCLVSTSELLRAEAKRLRSLADRCDAFAKEIESDGSAFAVGANGNAAKASLAINNGQTLPQMGEFSGLTQMNAVLKALERGPQTTRQIFELLTRNGQSFKKVSYITALLPRLKDKVERTSDGKKIKLKEAG